ncbi:hypothetical protein [Tunturiibacter psychrotolerans]|uniref:hypothetical protein n=1 Tax=Tunturiibacter psychrotolerans TaxID=3069686 RepID=UPI003D1FA04B
MKLLAFGASLIVIQLGSCLSDLTGGGEKWKVVRAPGTNSCAAIKDTAMDPSRPEVLGTYSGEAAATGALSDFKSKPDPNHAGMEVCM